MQFEYVTYAVPPGLLRCPHCGSKVRQVSQELPAGQSFAIALCGEPLAWVIIGVGALVGLAAQAVVAVLLVWVAVGLPALVWLYLSHLRRCDFLCTTCKAQSGYVQARSAAASHTRSSVRSRR